MILMVLSLAYVINYYLNDVCKMSDLTKNNIDSLYKEITLAINNRINKVVLGVIVMKYQLSLAGYWKKSCGVGDLGQVLDYRSGNVYNGYFCGPGEVILR